MIKHKVKSFTEWKKEFDSAVELRKSNGELSVQILQGCERPEQDNGA